jgi:hypothetical protein
VDFESKGRGFKSLRARSMFSHMNAPKINNLPSPRFCLIFRFGVESKVESSVAVPVVIVGIKLQV